MCGRFYVPEKDLDDFAGLVSKVEKDLLKKAGEICPGDYAPVITPSRSNTDTEQKEYQYHAVKWGFPTQQGKLIINARSETVHEKPLFRMPFTTRRCLIPARGFYEWYGEKNSKKRIKHFITSYDNSFIYLAGIYWFFRNKSGINLPCFTILTTRANDEISRIHDRMPVIIKNDDLLTWLYNVDLLTLQRLMAPWPDKLLIEEVK